MYDIHEQSVPTKTLANSLKPDHHNIPNTLLNLLVNPSWETKWNKYFLKFWSLRMITLKSLNCSIT